MDERTQDEACRRDLADIVDKACRSYRPARCNHAYWRDRQRNRTVFYVYMHARVDGSRYVGHTGTSLEERLREHRRKDPVGHVCRLWSKRMPNRSHAIGLENELVRRLREAGYAATKYHGPCRPGRRRMPNWADPTSLGGCARRRRDRVHRDESNPEADPRRE